MDQRVVHGDGAIAVPRRGGGGEARHRLPHAHRDVLDDVMPQIAAGLDTERDARVARERAEHVIEEWNGGPDRRSASVCRGIAADRDSHARLSRLTVERGHSPNSFATLSGSSVPV